MKIDERSRQTQGSGGRRHQLLEEAKKEAMDKAQAGISEHNALGFHYRLVEGDDHAPATVT
jgi:hypothetical protein